MHSYFVCLGCCVLLITAALCQPTVPMVNARGLMVTGEPKVADSCDFYCTRYDLPVCARNELNGDCLQKFVSECEMAEYNCRHPQMPFEVEDDWKCEVFGAPLCTRSHWERML